MFGMPKAGKIEDLIIGILLIFSVLLVVFSQLQRPALAEEKKYLIAPPPKLEYFSFGFQAALADQLWVRAIQDIDYCELRISENVCKENSWLAQMLLAITDLAPDYQAAYEEGGVALSVIISDEKGASQIFDRGVHVFPNSFNLLYRAGYQAYREEKDYSKAANLFLRAARLKGKDGDWLYSLANRLYVDGGQREIGVQIYEELKKSGMDEWVLERVREKLGIQKQ